MAHYPSRGESVWNLTTDAVEYPELRLDMSVDVAVIGAGIAGLTAAYLLKQRGVKVAVFEKYRIGDSVSGYTTAKVTSQHGLVYSELIQNFGKQTARVYAEANEAAIEMIEDIIKAERIDCDWRREDNYVFTDKSAEVMTLKKEAKDAASLGLPARYVESMPVGIPIKGAVRFENQATFHIVKYLHGLARAIDGDGCRVFEHTKASFVRDGDSEATFRTKNGKVRAGKIILATNIPSPIKDHIAYGLYEYPARSYLIAGRVDKKIPGMYINSGRPTRSILQTTLGGEDWLLVGGEGHLVGMSGPAERHYDALETYAREHFGLKEVSYRWTTWDYIAYDHMPLVGKLFPNSRNLYTATGFRKWGMTNATVAAMILTDQLTGGENPWAEAFRSNRLSAVTSMPKGLLQGLGLMK
jgi:glycine/D-amino acid oxidase-like deaminating enzyme